MIYMAVGDSKKLIRDALDRARDDWVEYTIAQQRVIYNLYIQASNQLMLQINKYAVKGVIPPKRLMLLINQVHKEMSLLRPKLRRLIRSSQKKSVDYGMMTAIYGAGVAMPDRYKIGIGTSFINKSGKIVRYDSKLEKYADSAWARLNSNAMDALVRTSYGGVTLSRRVWDVTWPVERQIRNQINLAVLTGVSANKVSKNIRQYLGLPETFKGEALKEFHPGAGIYRSAYKNAIRLTGTEINRGYNEGIFRYGMEKEWVVGYIWHTGSGNPCEECLDNEGSFFPKDNPPYIPLHPFCYCWPEIVYK